MSLKLSIKNGSWDFYYNKILNYMRLCKDSDILRVSVITWSQYKCEGTEGDHSYFWSKP